MPGQRLTFAIGDVHGCYLKLLRLLNHCKAFAGRRNSRVVFLGDYLDRGPDSRRVVEFLIDAQTSSPSRFVCLRGNHEALLVAAVSIDASEHDLANWLDNGGSATLASYGVRNPHDIPKEQIAWLKALPVSLRDGPRFFVHAGIRPGVSLEQQRMRDLLWIREPFLSSEVEHGALVVHGHTPTSTRRPEVLSNRVNLDTGAYLDGPLTAAVFIDAQRTPIAFITDMGIIVGD